MPIQIAKDAFDRKLAECENLILDSGDLVRDDHITVVQQYEIIEAAFLKGVIAWESLVSTCFLNYMMRSLDLNLREPPRYVTPKDLHHAESIVLEGRDYCEWISADFVRRIANNYFDAGWHVIPALDDAVVSQIRHVRNRIAHETAASEQRFQDVVRSLHGVAPTPPWRPGVFLLERRATNKPRYYKHFFRRLSSRANILVGI